MGVRKTVSDWEQEMRQITLLQFSRFDPTNPNSEIENPKWLGFRRTCWCGRIK